MIELSFELSSNLIQIELIVRLLLAVILVAIIDFERELSHKSAGLRTHIFVSMESCLFIVA
jgi:putative Mg2+ transporter-C (MgtC) family protein